MHLVFNKPVGLLVCVALICTGICLVPDQEVAGAAATAPHIVIMLADDLGWGDVGYHGSKIATPNIDRLAKQSVQLNQFYVQPVCSPTRGALMTGRYPMRLGLQCGVVRPWAQHGLPLDERTLAGSLKDAGYETAIVGKWHLGHVSAKYLPTRRGFEHQYGHYNGALDYFTHIRDGGHDWHRDDQRNDDKGYSTNLIAQEAVRLIVKRDKKRPLFLYVPFNAPHTPLQAPQSYIDKYQSMPQKNRRTYAAMVTCMDDGVGRILKAIDENQMASNTLVIFCSDNGGIPKLGSNGRLRAGKGTLYEGGVRVVALARWPKVLEAGAINNQPMHIVDLFPTLTLLAGGKLDGNRQLDGVDIWPALTKGKSLGERPIVLNLSPFHGALRRGKWKLIHNGHVGANNTTKSPKERWELFDLESDPSEKQELKARYPKVFEQLKSQLKELASQAVKPNIPPNKAPAGFKVPKVWGEPDH